MNPYPFSVSAAQQILSSHGWKVVPNGTTTCQNPTLCGAGITKGEGISFNIDYASGVVATEDEMNDLQAQARKVGININLTTHQFVPTPSEQSNTLTQVPVRITGATGTGPAEGRPPGAIWAHQGWNRFPVHNGIDVNQQGAIAAGTMAGVLSQPKPPGAPLRLRLASKWISQPRSL